MDKGDNVLDVLQETIAAHFLVTGEWISLAEWELDCEACCRTFNFEAACLFGWFLGNAFFCGCEDSITREDLLIDTGGILDPLDLPPDADEDPWDAS